MVRDPLAPMVRRHSNGMVPAYGLPMEINVPQPWEDPQPRQVAPDPLPPVERPLRSVLLNPTNNTEQRIRQMLKDRKKSPK